MASHADDDGGERTQGDVFAVARDPIFVYDIDDRSIADVNDAAVELLGYDQEVLVGANIAEFAPAGSEYTEDRARSAIETGIEDGENRFEWQLERADGEVRWVDISMSMATVRGESRLVAFVRDVTDQRQLTDELRTSREALQRLHDVSMTDQSADQKIERMLAVGAEFLGTEYAFLTEIDDGEQRIETALGDHDEIQAGGVTPYPETYCRVTIEGDSQVQAIHDVANSELADSEALDRFGLRCYLGGEVYVDGKTRGTVCFAGDEARATPFTETERMFVDVAARWIGSEIEDRQRRAVLEERRKQLEAVFETPGTFIGVLDRDGTLVRANQTVREFVGGELDPHLGDPFWTGPWFAHDEALQRTARDAIERAKDGTTVEFEATHVTPDGEILDVAVTVNPVTDGDGAVESIVVQGVDVTERKERERHLAAKQEQIDTIVGNVPIILFALDEDGVFTDSRGAGLEALGLENGEVVGQSAYDVYAGQPEILDDVERALEGNEIESDVELGGLHFHTRYQPVFDEDGTVEQVIGVSRDVSELREREQELAAWKSRLETVLDNAPVALYSYDPDGTITMSQGSGLREIGIEPGQLEGQNVFEVFPEADDLRADFERAREGERFSSVRELGETIFRTWYRPVMRDGKCQQVIGVSIDITEQRRQKRRIEAISEATSELITADSAVDVGELVIKLAGDLLDMPLSGLWTYDADQETLAPIAATDPVLAATDSATPEEALPHIEPGTDEMATFRRGETRIVEDYSSLEAPAHEDAPLETLVMVPLGSYGTLHVGSPENRVPSAAEVNIIEILARNAEAALERAQREQELATYREELEQSNERLQQFAYIASHDLQEPLRMVSSYVDLLAMEYGDELDEEADEYIEFAVNGAERMQSMIEDLLQYSRVQTKAAEFTQVDTESVVEETLRDLQFAIEEAGATVTTGDLPTVEADREQLGQVFQNLVGNAVKHGGETPTVSVRGVETDDGVRFEVEDDGPGIPEDQQERIFKIFQQGSRNEDDDGTGIGLAVVERIVSRHGGSIWIESAEGQGSTVCFTISSAVTDEDSLPDASGTDAS